MSVCGTIGRPMSSNRKGSWLESPYRQKSFFLLKKNQLHIDFHGNADQKVPSGPELDPQFSKIYSFDGEAIK